TVPLSGWGVHAGETPKTRLVMRVTKTNGTYQVDGDSIDQGYRGVPIDVFTYKNRQVHAAITAAHDSFDRKVNSSGKKITGQWKENNNSGPLEFVKTTNPPTFPEELTDAEFAPRDGSRLQGFWKGAIGTGKDALEVNIKIAEASDGTYRAD